MRGRKLLIRREQAWIVVATMAAICCGCEATRVSTKKNIPAAFRPVALGATREELLEKYNAAAHGVESINATVELKPTAGWDNRGLLGEDHEDKGVSFSAPRR